MSGAKQLCQRVCVAAHGGQQPQAKGMDDRHRQAEPRRLLAVDRFTTAWPEGFTMKKLAHNKSRSGSHKFLKTALASHRDLLDGLFLIDVLQDRQISLYSFYLDSVFL